MSKSSRLAHLGSLFALLLAFTDFVAAVAEPATPAEAAKTKFEVKRIRLGKKSVPVEMADDYAKREQGLMWRQSLAPDHGMLFVFDDENRLDFWMKNTLIPLSIGYFDRDKKLLRTFEMDPAIAGEAMPKIYSSGAPALYALEMPKGWFAVNKIAPGAKFEFMVDRSSTKKTSTSASK